MLLKARSVYCKRHNFFNLFAISEMPIFPFFIFLTIIIIGFICLYSTSEGHFYNSKLFKQLIHFIFYIPIFLIIISLNIKVLEKFSYPFLISVILLLILVLLFGKRTMGAVRWLNLGFTNIQPSEIAKIAIIMTLAKYFNNMKYRRFYRYFYEIILPLLIMMPVIILIIIQPDLATTMIIFILIGMIFFVSGMSIWNFYAIIAGFIVIAPILWNHMKQYQKLRIINFFNPESDPLGSGYNVIQSKIAIGSGGIFGKGFLRGTQGQFSFLPEHDTDFIFTTIGEEFGLIGAIVVLYLYYEIIKYGYIVSFKTQNRFGKILSFGCASLLFIHVFINIAMTIGLMPVAGIPLPMISYGGTMLLVSIVCFALMVNVDINHDII